MRKWIDILEGHHKYDDPDYNTKFSPVRAGDTFTVYHGFREFNDALAAAQHGLSGALRVPRTYSYEADNNPKGLFVSLSKKVAAEFVGAYSVQCIIEFTAKMSDLEAPVWPGGGYTVQGQMAQYFGHGAKGRMARIERGRAAEKETDDIIARDPEALAHIAQSDKRYLAHLLTNSREYQALFIGHLSPDEITAWWVRPSGSGSNVAWERISPAEFLSRYGETPARTEHDRVFAANEDFDGEEFITRMAESFASVRERDTILGFVKSAWEEFRKSANKMRTFRYYFDRYLWPKQYIPALKWMRDTFK